jgi:hypothetical protein
MDGWSIALWVVAGYLAVMTLARSMQAQRNHLIERFRRSMEREKDKQEEDDASAAAEADIRQKLMMQDGVSPPTDE